MKWNHDAVTQTMSRRPNVMKPLHSQRKILLQTNLCVPAKPLKDWLSMLNVPFLGKRSPARRVCGWHVICVLHVLPEYLNGAMPCTMGKDEQCFINLIVSPRSLLLLLSSATASAFLT